MLTMIGATPAITQVLWDGSSPKTPPLKIYAEFDQLQVLPGTVVTLTIRGFLKEGWHVYSVEKQGEYAPEPTKVSYQLEKHIEVGVLQESSPQIIEDKALDLTLAVHKREFVFSQQIKISPDAPVGEQIFEGTVHYHMCDNNICTPRQHQPFSTPLTIKP